MTRALRRRARRTHSVRLLRIGILVAIVIGLATSIFAWQQVQLEREIDLEDITRRAQAMVRQRSAQVLTALAAEDDTAQALLAGEVIGYRRLLGYAVFRPDGRRLAIGRGLLDLDAPVERVAADAVLAASEVTLLTHASGMLVHALAQPLPAHGQPQGVLVVVHDVSYLDERVAARLAQYAFWTLTVTLLAVALIVMANWIAYERPLSKLAEWMRRLRVDNAPDLPPAGLLSGNLHRESNELAASLRAARSSSLSLSAAMTHQEQVWTADRLRAHALAALADAQLVVVSNREPYMHQWRDGKPQVIVPAGGLVTALDPILQSCGGTWIAHGAGDADRAAADAHGRLTVPLAQPRYTLQRVWLSRAEEQGYYYGFANEGLWPLCHLAHERPVFRSDDWQHYQTANRRFADAVLNEIGSRPAVVVVQDYQLALVPRLLKEARPDLCVGMFWHIPWPNSDAFRICPWGAQILDGMLGADLLGFHLQQYCNNFLDTVDRILESRLDWDHCAIDRCGKRSQVRPFPISVQPWSERNVPLGSALEQRIAELRKQHQLGDCIVTVGVDRVDYTKGLPERFRAIARLLEKYPESKGRFVHIALGAPSRTHIPRYRAHMDKLEALADEINWAHRTDSWQPIHFLVAHHDPATVHAFMAMARVCIVSSLHDGMNLVAKEYVMAQHTGDGVLVLSGFAGAAGELPDALIINPYDTEQFADAMHSALTMPTDACRARMQRMRQQVEEHNIYRWAAALLAGLAEASTDVRGRLN
ncbi:MAG: trehalose-6-phosphate synthase [Gammaproteobacteria bacterium]|nr:trehalose-6-phosphate synthase [Gammaproteobacteria bacterium]